MTTRTKRHTCRPTVPDAATPVSLDDGAIWIVDCLALDACPGPRAGGGTEQIIAYLKAKVFAGRDVKWRTDGSAAIEKMIGM